MPKHWKGPDHQNRVPKTKLALQAFGHHNNCDLILSNNWIIEHSLFFNNLHYVRFIWSKETKAKSYVKGIATLLNSCIISWIILKGSNSRHRQFVGYTLHPIKAMISMHKLKVISKLRYDDDTQCRQKIVFSFIYLRICQTIGCIF